MLANFIANYVGIVLILIHKYQFMKRTLTLALPFLLLAAPSCKKDKNKDEPKIVFKLVFDPAQERLNNFGLPATIPAGNAAQTPSFNSLSVHYVELTPQALTALGAGEVLYKADEVNINGENAIDFAKSNPVGNNQEFFSMNLKDVKPGTYEWLRVSLAYQNYDIDYRIVNPLNTSETLDLKGTIASFIGYNTYITTYKIKNETQTINAAKKQGYWGFETNVMGFSYTTSGQAPAGATTVVNPLFATSPIPAGSCVVTASFDQPLVITGDEKKDIVVTVKLSTNQSFEWNDTNSPDGIFQPDKGDVPVDMGIRGMKTSWKVE